MADDNDIVSKVSIEGIDEAKAKLASVGDSGAQAFNKIASAAESSAAAVNASFDRMAERMAKRSGVTPADMLERIATQGRAMHEALSGGGAAPSNAPAGETGGGEAFNIVKTFREAVHALHPVAAEAGVSLGELTPLMYAARGGVEVLAIALAGTLVTSLEKAGDAARDAAVRIGAFGGSMEKGGEQYGQLRRTAGALGVPTSELTGAFEEILRTQQKYQIQISSAQMQELLSTAIKGGEAARISPEVAAKGLAEFIASVRKEGRATPEGLEALSNANPLYGAALTQQLQRQGGGLSAANVFRGMGSIGAEIDQQYEAMDKGGIRQSWERLKSVTEQAVGGGGGRLVAGGLDVVSAFIGGVSKALSVPEVNKNGLFYSGTAESGVDKLTGKIKELGNSAPDAAKGVDQILNELKKADPHTIIAERLAILGTQRAGVEDKFAKAEAENQLKHDEIALANAQDAQKSAIFNHEEALKNLELAKLAPQSASLNVDQARKNVELSKASLEVANSTVAGAQLNAEQASLNLKKLEAQGPGRGPFAEQQYELDKRKLEHAQHEDALAIRRAEAEEKYAPQIEKRAKLEAEKADIEYRYANLIPAKAALDAQKTQRDIETAAWEAGPGGSANLKLVKDQNLSGINTAEKNLVYQQKQVDLLDMLQKTEGDNAQRIVNELKAVVAAIHGIGGGRRGGEAAGLGTSEYGSNRIPIGSIRAAPRSVFQQLFSGGTSEESPLGNFAENLSNSLAPRIPSFTTSNAISSPASSPAHYSVDLRTDHGSFKMLAPEDTARQLSRYAVKQKLISTGDKPSWYGE